MLSASIEIQIKNTWEIITPEKAVDIAHSLPDVSKWCSEHSGPKVVRYEDGQYYLYSNSEWQKVASNFSGDGMTIHEIQQKYEPYHEVQMVKDVWDVRFISKLGPPPSERMVAVEPTTGRVLSVK